MPRIHSAACLFVSCGGFSEEGRCGPHGGGDRVSGGRGTDRGRTCGSPVTARWKNRGSDAEPLGAGSGLCAQMMSPGPFSDVSASPADANATVRIGIQQTTAVNVLQPGDGGFLDRTKDRIREAFGSRRVEFMTLTRGELAEAIRNGDVDFVIGQSDFIAQAQMENNLRLIVSFWPVEARDVNSVASAVFFTKAQSLDVQSLAPRLRAGLPAGALLHGPPVRKCDARRAVRESRGRNSSGLCS